LRKGKKLHRGNSGGKAGLLPIKGSNGGREQAALEIATPSFKSGLVNGALFAG
jgi:hypothetical protein